MTASARRVWSPPRASPRWACRRKAKSALERSWASTATISSRARVACSACSGTGALSSTIEARRANSSTRPTPASPLPSSTAGRKRTTVPRTTPPRQSGATTQAWITDHRGRSTSSSVQRPARAEPLCSDPLLHRAELQPQRVQLLADHLPADRIGAPGDAVHTVELDPAPLDPPEAPAAASSSRSCGARELESGQAGPRPDSGTGHSARRRRARSRPPGPPGPARSGPGPGQARPASPPSPPPAGRCGRTAPSGCPASPRWRGAARCGTPAGRSSPPAVCMRRPMRSARSCPTSRAAARLASRTLPSGSSVR